MVISAILTILFYTAALGTIPALYFFFIWWFGFRDRAVLPTPLRDHGNDNSKNETLLF
jgi:hypothetical protein